MGIQEGGKRERGVKSLVKEIIAENFSNLRKELDIQVHKANTTPYYLNPKRSSLKYIILKLSKTTMKTEF